MGAFPTVTFTASFMQSIFKGEKEREERERIIYIASTRGEETECYDRVSG